MEWVEVTAKTVEEAKDLALDRLGVAVDDAEFEIVQQPSKGLFGLMRGEARVRARVRPTAVRPKRERRERGPRRERASAPRGVAGEVAGEGADNSPADAGEPAAAAMSEDAGGARGRPRRSGRGGSGRSNESRRDNRGNGTGASSKEHKVEQASSEPVDPAAVGEAAAAFMRGLTEAFGSPAEVEVVSNGSDLEVRANGADLGLLIGPGGRTLTAVQDLARVAAQRRLGDHDTRLKIDVSGYREKRRAALEKFTRTVAAGVIESGRSTALEPMSSADRKIVHDTVTEIDGVTSRSDGDDPARRVVISPA